MSLPYFPYQRRNSHTKGTHKVQLYRFTNDFNDRYLVEVFFYQYNVYAIKFSMMKHRLSPRRYNIVYTDAFKKKMGAVTGNANFLKVMNTIIMIAREIVQNDSIASFGFMGAPREDENDRDKNGSNINPDCTVANTKRYRVYNLYAKRYFNPQDFEYVYSQSSSILLLRNIKNTALTKKVAEDYINKVVIPSL